MRAPRLDGIFYSVCVCSDHNKSGPECIHSCEIGIFDYNCRLYSLGWTGLLLSKSYALAREFSGRKSSLNSHHYLNGTSLGPRKYSNHVPQSLSKQAIANLLNKAWIQLKHYSVSDTIPSYYCYYRIDPIFLGPQPLGNHSNGDSVIHLHHQ